MAGTALYVYLVIAGSCLFTIDGDEVGVFNNTVPTGNIHLAYYNTSMPDGPHVLLISPTENVMLIEYTCVNVFHLHTVVTST